MISDGKGFTNLDFKGELLSNQRFVFTMLAYFNHMLSLDPTAQLEDKLKTKF